MTRGNRSVSQPNPSLPNPNEMMQEASHSCPPPAPALPTEDGGGHCFCAPKSPHPGTGAGSLPPTFHLRNLMLCSPSTRSGVSGWEALMEPATVEVPLVPGRARALGRLVFKSFQIRRFRVTSMKSMTIAFHDFII